MHTSKPVPIAFMPSFLSCTSFLICISSFLNCTCHILISSSSFLNRLLSFLNWCLSFFKSRLKRCRELTKLVEKSPPTVVGKQNTQTGTGSAYCTGSMARWTAIPISTCYKPWSGQRYDTAPARQYWFQQDGAPPHVTKPVMEFLHSKFGGRVISRNSEHVWPAYSPDLSCLDSSLWSIISSKVYKAQTATIQQLKQVVKHVVGNLDEANLSKIARHTRRRAELCVSRRGGIFEHLLWCKYMEEKEMLGFQKQNVQTF